jgi:phospholipid N-methyltransferase
MNKDYYNSLWWQDYNAHGSLFWRNVNHSLDSYRYQEEVFRNHISYLVSHNIQSVLELGAGTGRMTKIVLEELGMEDGVFNWPHYRGIQKYDCVDLNCGVHMVNIMKHLGPALAGRCNWLNLDITSKEFDLIFDSNDHTRRYDLILASEVFMHILPKDIDSVISKVSKLLNDKGHIINIDWSYSSKELDKSEWCFIHDYDKLYSNNGLVPIGHVSMPSIKQGLYHYRAKS